MEYEKWHKLLKRHIYRERVMHNLGGRNIYRLKFQVVNTKDSNLLSNQQFQKIIAIAFLSYLL